MEILEFFANAICNLETTEEVVFLWPKYPKIRKIRKIINPKDHRKGGLFLWSKEAK
jgi:hypothetical protein